MTLACNNSLTKIEIRNIFVATYESRFVMLFILIKHLISKTIWKAWKLIHAQIDFHKTLKLTNILRDITITDKELEVRYTIRTGAKNTNRFVEQHCLCKYAFCVNL